MVTHKKTKALGGGWTACSLKHTEPMPGYAGRALVAQAVWHWKHVTCKNCLRTRKGKKR